LSVLVERKPNEKLSNFCEHGSVLLLAVPSFALHACSNDILEKGCQRKVFKQEKLRLQRL
jgi:hypothetical protein